MPARLRSASRCAAAVCSLALAAATAPAPAGDAAPAKDGPKLAEPVTKGMRVFYCSHSFHVFMPAILQEMLEAAGIKDQVKVGQSSIGGSKAIQHWNVPDEKNQVKPALREGKVDLLSLAVVHLPDEGLENFTKLALEHNPNIRITVQEFWLRWDIFEPTTKLAKGEKVDHNAITGEELRKRHAPYFQGWDGLIRELNKKYGKTVLFVVPAGQAVIALREKIIAGQAPGLKTQEDLFSDELGHGKPPLEVLVSYCHFAVMYRRSPVGLPLPSSLAKMQNPDGEKLNRLLQEIAWQAAIQHPLSGLQADARP
ncbi:MAG: hypothetical protein ABSE73_06950 [Planctomycetota bacterium]